MRDATRDGLSGKVGVFGSGPCASGVRALKIECCPDRTYPNSVRFECSSLLPVSMVLRDENSCDVWFQSLRYHPLVPIR